jgi:protein SCO1/2
MAKLARDIGLLMLEKDKKNKGAIFRKILDLTWLWLIIISAILFFVVYMRQRRKING